MLYSTATDLKYRYMTTSLLCERYLPDQYFQLSPLDYNIPHLSNSAIWRETELY